METVVTPFQSFGGGALIGLAAVLSLLLLGRVLGATGIVAGALAPSDARDRAWRAAMLAGMISAPTVYWLATGGGVAIAVPVSTLSLVAGGVMVGVGVTLASGCTSGHGVCGLARASRRSLAATLTFMATAALTVFAARHLIGA